MKLACALLATAACGGVSGTLDISLIQPPNSNLFDSVDHFVITLTEPRQAYTITRGSDGTFHVGFDVDTTNANGSFIVQGFDANDTVIAVGQSPPIPIAAIDATVKIFVAPPNSLSRTEDVVAPRLGTTAFALSFGVGVAGGFNTDSTGNVVTPLEVYNAYDNSLKEGASLPMAVRANFAAAVNASGVVFLFGGNDQPGTPQGTLFRFDPTQPPNGTYTQLSDNAEFARTRALALPIGGDKFVISSGIDPTSGALSGVPLELAASDGSIASLNSVATLPPVGAAVNGADGVTTAVFVDSTQITRFHGEAINQLTVPEAQRTHLAVTGGPGGAGGVIVIAGGADATNTPVREFVTLDASADTTMVTDCVASAACLQVPRFDAAAAATARYLLVAGGTTTLPCTDASCQADAELFDATSLAFIATLPLNDHRTGAQAIALENNQILIYGGTDASGNAVGSIELFTPDLPADF